MIPNFMKIHILLKCTIITALLLLVIACNQTESLPTPTSKDTFRRLWQDPPTLDPHLVSDTTSAGILVEIFSGLVTISPDLRLEPDIASRWEVAKNGSTYTFYLRPNAKFHDGTLVTADDVKYSLERALSPNTMAPGADNYLDDIVGAAEKLSGKADEVSGIKVIDSHTLEITIVEPRAYFLAKLTYPTAFIVDKNNIETMGEDWVREPNGTGPFKLREYQIGEKLILEANDNFYLEPPKVQFVEFILRGGSSMAMYENNEIHITGVGLGDIDRVTNPEEPLNKDLVVVPPSFDIYYIGLNVNQPPFEDKHFRRALSYAIDRELIADRVLANMFSPATTILPEGFPGYTGEVTGLEFDPESALSELQNSSYRDNVPLITITVPGTGGSIGLDMEAIIEMWRTTLGIEVEIQQVEWATFLEDLNQDRFQAFAGIGWQADYPDPHGMLDINFHSNSPLNHNSYSNLEVDNLLEEARSASWEDRKMIYRMAEQIIVDDAPWIPLWYSGDRMVLIKPEVEGYRLTPLITPKLRYISLEN